jgi:1-deoxy-D-xylulose-5-phosphate reductoisomerase
MVEFRDGAVIAQASPPDMRLPIALGLSAPARMPDVASPCDWSQASQWTFETVDDVAFPAVRLARQALAASEKHTVAMNAANEQAVKAFLEHRLPYLGIIETVTEVLDRMDAHFDSGATLADVEEMLDIEGQAREAADAVIGENR